MRKKERYKRIVRRTAGGTSAMVASKSQMRPLRTEIQISEFGSITASENCRHRTCFQRRRPKPKAPPASRRRRSKPMSMMRSNATSETSEPTTLGLVVSKLRVRQAFASGDHAERIYGCQVSRAGPKQPKLEIYPYVTCDITRNTRDSPISVGGTYQGRGVRYLSPI